MDGSNAIRGLFVDCSRVVRGLFVGCSRGLHKLVLETWQKLCVKSTVCSWKIRKLFASCSRAIGGCSGTVRRTSWAWARPWDQMKHSRWNEIIGSKNSWETIPVTKNAGIEPVKPKPVGHDLIQKTLKEKCSGEQPLGKTSGTEAMGQDTRHKTVKQNFVGKNPSKTLGQHLP